jgi:hypothetical protein
VPPDAVVACWHSPPPVTQACTDAPATGVAAMPPSTTVPVTAAAVWTVTV